MTKNFSAEKHDANLMIGSFRFDGRCCASGLPHSTWTPNLDINKSIISRVTCIDALSAVRTILTDSRRFLAAEADTSYYAMHNCYDFPNCCCTVDFIPTSASCAITITIYEKINPEEGI